LGALIKELDQPSLRENGPAGWAPCEHREISARRSPVGEQLSEAKYLAIIWKPFPRLPGIAGRRTKGAAEQGVDLTSWASGFHSLAAAFKMVEPRGVEPLTFSLRMVTKYPDYQQDTKIMAEMFGNFLETLHGLAYSNAQACKALHGVAYGTRTQKIQ
jgi:hypothetical protein